MSASDMRGRLADISRRTLLAAGGAAFAARAFGQGSLARRSRLILLGTKGGPTPSRVRAPASSVLIVDGEPFVIDAPDGVARQLALAGIDLSLIRNIFLTHHHSDHMAGLSALLLLAWGAGLQSPVTVHGPAPVEDIVKSGLEAGAADILYRIREEGRPDLRNLVRVQTLTAASVALDRPPIRVAAAPVSHYTVPAFAYRIDTPDRSFVFSGDTAPSTALVDLARGADVLVHEAMYLPALDRLQDANAPLLREHLLKSHTTTEQLGELAAAAGVRTLVLSHLVPAFADITEAMWTEGVRKHFSGEIIVGRDQMEI